MVRTLRCGWDGCKRRFTPKGNQRYCGPECAANARRVSNRRAQRKHRRRLREERKRRLAARCPPAELLSAVQKLLFRVPLRPLPPDRVAPGRAPGGLLLQTLPHGLPQGPPATAPSRPESPAPRARASRTRPAARIDGPALLKRDAANAFRLLLHTAAHNIMVLLRRRLRLPELLTAEMHTLRIKLIKVAAVVRQTARRIWFELSSSWPFASLFESAQRALVPGPSG